MVGIRCCWCILIGKYHSIGAILETWTTCGRNALSWTTTRSLLFLFSSSSSLIVVKSISISSLRSSYWILLLIIITTATHPRSKVIRSCSICSWGICTSQVLLEGSFRFFSFGWDESSSQIVRKRACWFSWSIFCLICRRWLRSYDTKWLSFVLLFNWWRWSSSWNVMVDNFTWYIAYITYKWRITRVNKIY